MQSQKEYMESALDTENYFWGQSWYATATVQVNDSVLNKKSKICKPCKVAVQHFLSFRTCNVTVMNTMLIRTETIKMEKVNK